MTNEELAKKAAESVNGYLFEPLHAKVNAHWDFDPDSAIEWPQYHIDKISMIILAALDAATADRDTEIKQLTEQLDNYADGLEAQDKKIAKLTAELSDLELDYAALSVQFSSDANLISAYRQQLDAAKDALEDIRSIKDDEHLARFVELNGGWEGVVWKCVNRAAEVYESLTGESEATDGC